MRHWVFVAGASFLLLITAACAEGDDAKQPAQGSVGASGECTLEAPVKIGVVFSQTGAAAVYGATQLNGLKLAEEEIEAASEVDYELVVEDDASDPAQGITAFEKLINQDNVTAIIGPTLSNTALSTNPIAQEKGVPVLGVSNTAAGITEIGDYIFRNSLTEGQVIPQTIAAAQDQHGIQEVAVLYGDDDAFTQSGYEVFKQALADAELKTTTTQTFAKGDTDFSPQLTEAKGTNPDALVVSALAEEGALIVEQARQLGLDVPVIGGNGFNSPALIEGAGGAAEGVIVGAAWNSASDDPLTKDFITAYEAAYGSPPDQFAAQAYAGMKILAHAVEDACSSDGVQVRDALATTSGLETVLGDFSFTENRDADHEPVVQVVENGKFSILE